MKQISFETSNFGFNVTFEYKGLYYNVKVLPDIAVHGGCNGPGTTVHVWTDKGLRGYQGRYSKTRIANMIRANK